MNNMSKKKQKKTLKIITFLSYIETFSSKNSFQASNHKPLNQNDFKIMRTINPVKHVQTFDWQFKYKSIK